MFAIVDGKQRALFGVDVAFTIIPTLLVLLRIYCRLQVKNKLTATDYCLLGALLFDWAITASGFIIVLDGGVGLHQSELSTPTIISYLKTLFSIELLWACAEGLLKTSMCLFFIEIFPTRRFRIVSYVVIALCNAFAATVILSTTFICDPVALSWDVTLKGTCGNRNALWLAIGILNIFTDLLVLALPVPQVWKLQITTRQKFAVSGIFGLGFFIIRLKFLLQVDFYGDTAYTVADAVLWSTLEPTTGVAVACLPSYGYFLRKWQETSLSKGSARVTRSMKRTDIEGFDMMPSRRMSNDTAAPIYPLGSVAITSGAEDDSSEQSDSLDAGNHGNADSVAPGKISVRQEWHVSHT